MTSPSTPLRKVRVVEVGPRDGLQNEAATVPASIKLQLIERLVAAGLKSIEATAFVSPKWVPQMADHAEVMRGVVLHGLEQHDGVRYSALTPNLKGFLAAREAGAHEVAVFGAASESFSRKNISCSIAESLQRFEELFGEAKGSGASVRGYVSCALGCPYEGDVAASAVADVAQALVDMGCYEIVLSDTVGVGTAAKTQWMIDEVARWIPRDQLACDFHDTYGQALTNVYAALQLGLSVFDSSVAGLGGCPYAAGGSGNLATEDLVYLLDGLDIETGIDLPRLAAAGDFICGYSNQPTRSRVAPALAAQTIEG